MRGLATDPAARGLLDDAAVLPFSGDLVLTKDLLVEGVHYLPDDPPADVAWKLVATNLSDLAAKGATPLGLLLGYPLGDPAWDRAFIAGLGEVLARFAVPLLGGDTVQGRGPRTLSLTALGRAPAGGAPDRRGARAGDTLWVTGTIGEAGLGLVSATAGLNDAYAHRYRRPEPRLAAGRALGPLVTAMCDVSDGLLIDAARIAAASNLAVTIDLDAAPLVGEGRAARLAAATAGDDYELLFALPPGTALPVLDVPATRIGAFAPGTGLTLSDAAGPVPLPAALGWQH
ncbi:thiamine-monophosphate kinase [Sphingomonas jatrophae]|uniref:Thiamine-monophosphate kinase n=1 Tax=Sphingomonas jatrophae TaxID=1166337 RepID=A0A1I6L4Q1_9SPHN|nr:thiamine-monophosphate kinase [Sphingomonas jatrophae]